ncbi:hypothetical protein [Acetobacter thailandicus]|uniref:hypothetical protein n=1 Tax=Acetobacter thailandicus TaxID=1502842 RepID=UPI001BADE335|nr:hypothetical protein [Acetobacter thailandicus]MBS0985771.1 hypothetical protein [Acetobacter thailandicus]
MTFDQYLEKIVIPTVNDFFKQQSSERLCFLACVVLYHCVDYAADNVQTTPKTITDRWAKESIEFALVDAVANHLKHVKSRSQRQTEAGKVTGGIPIYRAVFSPDENGDLRFSLHNMYFIVRDCLRFICSQTDTVFGIW